MKNRTMQAFALYAISASTVFLLSNEASAQTNDPTYIAVSEFLSTMELEKENQEGSPENYGDSIESLVDLYKASNAAKQSPVNADIAEFWETLVHEPLLDIETTRYIVQTVLAKPAHQITADEHALLAVILSPYARNAGLCVDDPYEADSAFCQFIVPGTGVSAMATSVNPYTSETVDVREPPMGSDLAKIMAPPVECYTHKATAESDRSVEESAANHVISDILNFLIPPAAAGDKTQFKFEIEDSETTDDGCLRLKVGYFFAAYLRNQDFDGKRLRVDSMAWALGQTGATTADTVIAQLPFALSCGLSCIVDFLSNCVGKVIRDEGDETVLLCGLRGASKKYYSLRNPGSYTVQAHAPHCGVTPAAYEGRPYFTDYRDNPETPETDYDFLLNDQNFGFHTSHQVPPEDAAAENTVNMFPAPTRTQMLANPENASAEIQNSWIYEYTQIKAWDFNILFSASDAYSASGDGTVCSQEVSHPNNPDLRVTGDQYSFYHGEPGSRLWMIDIALGWDSAHEPITCDDTLPILPVPLPDPSTPLPDMPSIALGTVGPDGTQLIYAPAYANNGTAMISWTASTKILPSPVIGKLWYLWNYVLESSQDPTFSSGVKTLYKGRQRREHIVWGVSPGTHYYRVKAVYACSGLFDSTIESDPDDEKYDSDPTGYEKNNCGTEYPKSNYIGPNQTVFLE